MQKSKLKFNDQQTYEYKIFALAQQALDLENN